MLIIFSDSTQKNGSYLDERIKKKTRCMALTGKNKFIGKYEGKERGKGKQKCSLKRSKVHTAGKIDQKKEW